MARKNVTKAVQAWLSGSDCRGTTISCRAGVLYSYSMPIARKVGAVLFVQAKRPGYFTMTTAQHLGGLFELLPSDALAVELQDLEWAAERSDLLEVAGDVALTDGAGAGAEYVHAALKASAPAGADADHAALTDPK